MKNKGAEAEPAKRQCPDRRDEKPFSDKCDRAPAQSEEDLTGNVEHTIPFNETDRRL
jgi:hypothetical protein